MPGRSMLKSTLIYERLGVTLEQFLMELEADMLLNPRGKSRYKFNKLILWNLIGNKPC